MNSKRRKAITRSNPIDKFFVFESHNWVCIVCKGKIDPDARQPDPRAATLDHVVPLSKGGQHVLENLAPAHAECNASKGCGLLLDTEWGLSVLWVPDVQNGR